MWWSDAWRDHLWRWLPHFFWRKVPVTGIWMDLCCWLKTVNRDWTMKVVRYFRRMGPFGGVKLIKNVHSFPHFAVISEFWRTKIAWMRHSVKCRNDWSMMPYLLWQGTHFQGKWLHLQESVGSLGPEYATSLPVLKFHRQSAFAIRKGALKFNFIAIVTIDLWR